jgi:hypothetical protein
MTLKDVKIEEYYYAEYRPDKFAIIKPNQNGSFKDCKGFSDKSYYRTNCWSCKNNLRLATKHEKQWLDLCIKHNKFMPQPELKQNIYELW